MSSPPDSLFIVSRSPVASTACLVSMFQGYPIGIPKGMHYASYTHQHPCDSCKGKGSLRNDVIMLMVQKIDPCRQGPDLS